MRQSSILIVSLFSAVLAISTPAGSQSTSESLAAAKELIEAMRLTDQMRQLMPIMLQGMKPLITQGRPAIERDFDTIAPIAAETMNARMAEFIDAVAELYAQNFTASELGEVTAFYRRPTGQKFLQKLPAVTQQSMALGQRWGESVGPELEKRIIDELRKRGHKVRE
jgi:uncharacterized protein